jgi:hypothetical protein
MTTSVTDDRQAFEAWAKDVGHDVRRTEAGTGYASIDTHNAWNAWQAALRSQGKVLNTGDLIALREEVRVQASLKDHYADWEETERMFTAIIGEGD